MSATRVPVRAGVGTLVQPSPVPNLGAPVANLVVEDLRGILVNNPQVDRFIVELCAGDTLERKELGRGQYGVVLQAKNGREPLIDAYQEALDQAQYLRQWLEEHPNRANPRVKTVRRLYDMTLAQVVGMRELIEEGY